MSNDSIHANSARVWFARQATTIVLSLVTVTGASAQSTNARPHCIQVGGSVMTNFLDPGTTLGTATGDLRGAVSASLLGVSAGANGTTVFGVQHHWVTEAGDTIDMAVAQATAAQSAPGMFAILSYPVTIIGGTGKF